MQRNTYDRFEVPEIDRSFKQRCMLCLEAKPLRCFPVSREDQGARIKTCDQCSKAPPKPEPQRRTIRDTIQTVSDAVPVLAAHNIKMDGNEERDFRLAAKEATPYVFQVLLARALAGDFQSQKFLLEWGHGDPKDKPQGDGQTLLELMAQSIPTDEATDTK